MALVRELIRRNKRNLRLVPAPGSIAPDMLIGAGCVAETGCVFISFEQFGLAPHFRRAAESGSDQDPRTGRPGDRRRPARRRLRSALWPDPGHVHGSAARQSGDLSAGSARARRARHAEGAGDSSRRGAAACPAGRRTRQRAIFRAGVLRRADGAGGKEGHRLGRSHRADRSHPARQPSDQIAFGFRAQPWSRRRSALIRHRAAACTKPTTSISREYVRASGGTASFIKYLDTYRQRRRHAMRIIASGSASPRLPRAGKADD